jgi:hypothetical protein
VDPIYYIEFRFLNKGGQVATELLQKSGSSNDNIVNSKIEFLGKDIGLLTFGTSTFPFSFVADNWNRVNIFLNMTTGAATFTLNEVMMKEWQWHVQIGGTANTNPFKGIRFVNNAGTDGASGFIDNLVIDRQNLLSTEPVLNPEIGIVYVPGTREVVLNGIQSGEIMEISLYDLQGRKLITRVNPANLVFPIGGNLPHGVYLIVVSPKNSRSFTSKIAILD